MAIEIERKFLLRNESWRTEITLSTYFRQGYLSTNEKSSVRIRIEGDNANINIKSKTLSISRQEYEYPIAKAEAEELLENLCDQPQIEKTRHIVRIDQHCWEIDEFCGANEGLIVAEIELQSEAEFFKHPSWLGNEVSEEVRYYNVNLVTMPYQCW